MPLIADSFLSQMHVLLFIFKALEALEAVASKPFLTMATEASKHGVPPNLHSLRLTLGIPWES